MSNISEYKFDIKQIGPVNFNVEIITPEGLVFTNNRIQAHPGQINNELLFQHFLDKKTRQHWALNVESTIIEDKPAPVIEEKTEEKPVIVEEKQEILVETKEIPPESPAQTETIVYES